MLIPSVGPSLLTPCWECAALIAAKKEQAQRDIRAEKGLSEPRSAGPPPLMLTSKETGQVRPPSTWGQANPQNTTNTGPHAQLQSLVCSRPFICGSPSTVDVPLGKASMLPLPNMCRGHWEALVIDQKGDTKRSITAQWVSSTMAARWLRSVPPCSRCTQGLFQPLQSSATKQAGSL